MTDMREATANTSDEACAVACMLVSNPQGALRQNGDGWQRRVNDLIRALRDERNALKAEIATMAAPQGGEAVDGLKPCPFCGGRAELDSRRGYRSLTTGNIESAVAIYCLQCSADMSICHRDRPGIDPSELADELREAWNKRATG